MTNTDLRCRCCPKISAIRIGGALLCVSPHPELPQGGSPVGRRGSSVGPRGIAAADTNSFDDLAPTIAELEAAWLLQPRASELRGTKFEPAPALPPEVPLTATVVVVGEPASAVAFSFPEIPALLLRSKNATTLAATAANGIQVSSSSSDTP